MADARLASCDRLLTSAMRRQYGAMVDALNALPADDRRDRLADAVVKAGALRPGPLGEHCVPSWPGEREMAIASAVVAYIRRPVDAWAEEQLTSGFAHFWRGRSVKDYMHSGKPSSASMCGASFISELDARDVAGVRNPTAALDEYAKKVGAKSRYDLTVDQSTKAFKLALGCPEVTP